jgi:hypothetical protein
MMNMGATQWIYPARCKAAGRWVFRLAEFGLFFGVSPLGEPQ